MTTARTPEKTDNPSAPAFGALSRSLVLGQATAHFTGDHPCWASAIDRWLPMARPVHGATTPRFDFGLSLRTAPVQHPTDNALRFGKFTLWERSGIAEVIGPDGLGGRIDLTTGEAWVWSPRPDPETCWLAVQYCLRPLWYVALGRAGLHPVHASSVVVRGTAWLVIGASGAGKSTLAARMAAAGAPFLSDDNVFIEEGSIAVHGLADACRLLPPAPDEGWRDPGGKRAVVHASSAQGPYPAGLLALLRTVPADQGWSCTPAAPADTMAVLMNSLLVMIDPDTTPGRLATLAALAESTPAISIARPLGS